MAKKVLVVDDEPYMIEMIRPRLVNSGYDVISAVTGEDCLAKAEKERPDLILLDILLPGMSGIEVLKRLKSNKQTRNIPVIMVTALAGKDTETKGLESGATYFISKPFDSQELLSDVQKAMEKRAPGRR